MKILIAEDDEDKIQDIIDLLDFEYPGCQIDAARSLQSGLDMALSGDFDFALLDMTMPNYERSVTDDGGRPHAFAGREILRQMKRRKVKTPAIVVTHFHRFGPEDDFTTLEQLKIELETRFPNYLGTVRYRGNVDDWRSELMAFIKIALGKS